MDQRTELSEFLRTRRARLRPEDVGLPQLGRRRVPGLRREELAQLAGVSVAYYTRLEQGHGHNVSGAVLDAISNALRLNEAERDHLRNLVRPVHRRRRSAPAQRVRPELQQLLDTMDNNPTVVLGRRLDVIGWNRLACALFGDFAELTRKQRNLARLVFRDPVSRTRYVDWEAKAADVVGYLRLDVGRYPDDPHLADLVDELSQASEDFRRLWAAHDVNDKGHGRKRLHHPLVGEFTLGYETLHLPTDPEQRLIAYHAEPGSPSADALRLLASADAAQADRWNSAAEAV
ncbi:helix-turn-helix domain-containing protein [Saccharopolyspora rosea]|uniref:helix-turn-helix domain-containing protein n=1 Tax=Saccharopolyspora rosea TaxID=524884 RepID=UPI0021DAD66A|nr:helix-turn-helix transcriptional regulator [Saccharopolyspora rosea]